MVASPGSAPLGSQLFRAALQEPVSFLLAYPFATLRGSLNVRRNPPQVGQFTFVIQFCHQLSIGDARVDL